MTWTWKEIERDRLGDSRPPDRPAVIVEAFDRLDAAFGWPWIEASRSRDGKPDFRIHRDQAENWLYVEVTRPDTSAETRALQGTLRRLSQPVEAIRRSSALELYLRRPPTDAEVELLVEHVEEAALLDGFSTQELPNDLGRLFLNEHPPGQVVLDDHGEP